MNDTSTQRKDVLREITDRLIVEFHPEKIYLFGSHAWGTPDDESDLDLLVIVKDSALKSAQRAQRAYRCLRGIDVPVDVLVKTRAEVDFFKQVHASLVSEVLDDGVLVYG